MDYFVATKFFPKGSQCIADCFEGYRYRHYDEHTGEMLPIEVPHDVWEDAQAELIKRVKHSPEPFHMTATLKENWNDAKGLAEFLVRQSPFTYTQVKALSEKCRFFKYHHENGQISIENDDRFSLSALVAYFLVYLQTNDSDEATQYAAYANLKVGGTSWLYYLMKKQGDDLGFVIKLLIENHFFVNEGDDKLAVMHSLNQSFEKIYLQLSQLEIQGSYGQSWAVELPSLEDMADATEDIFDCLTED